MIIWSELASILAVCVNAQVAPSTLLESVYSYKLICNANMAVFTPVSQQDARTLLADYQLGELVSLEGIAAGIENTNHFLTTTKGEFVLTTFEVLTFKQLPFYIELMHYLAQRKIPVPEPQTRDDGSRISTLCGKPAAIVTKLPGSYTVDPTAKHCAAGAATLAYMHLAAKDFSIQQPNLRGLDWWIKTAPIVQPFLTKDQSILLSVSLAEQQAYAKTAQYSALPEGPAHCDLFRDNVLFAGSQAEPVLGGFIDFYFAGCDKWIFDIAVCVNDWCIERQTGLLIPKLAEAWLEAYNQVRPFTDAERQAWPVMLRAAALRFWLSRLYDFHVPRAAEMLKPHDPTHFERVLFARMNDAIVNLP
jgi:homoserine kinase type II